MFTLKSDLPWSQATFKYLERVRESIGNDKFKALFELGGSSALAVTIDTSGSMSGEIEAVKNEILEIIATANAGGIAPSQYILAPYGGPFGPTVELTITEDTDKVTEVITSLSASGADEVTFQAFQVLTASI